MSKSVDEPKNMGGTLSKFIGFFQRKNAVTDASENQPQEVPGSLGLTLFNIIGLVKSGHNFYRKKRDENRTNIFKVRIYKPRIVLCNYDAFRHLYESPYVRKEASFGMFDFNYASLGGHCPLIFQNDELHDKRRKIFIELAKTLFCNETFIENICRDIESEMVELSKVFENNGDFEDAIANAVNNVLTQNIIGKRIDHKLIKGWMDNCLVKKFQSPQPEAPEIYEKIRDVIKTSEKFRKFCEHVQENVGDDVTDTDVCNEMIFALIFNAYKALSSIVTSCLAHLSNISQEDLNLLKSEATRFHQSSNKANEAGSLQNIENYVLEMFRLFPPAAFVFRRVTQSFVISLNSGDYQIQKDDLLCGNVYLCQRDPDIFENPDNIDIHRYKTVPKLKEYLTCFGAPFLQENIPGIHKCAGQKIALTLAKMFAIHCLFLNVEHASKPTWSGKEVKRLVGTDKPLKIKNLQYNRPDSNGNETQVEQLKEFGLM